MPKAWAFRQDIGCRKVLAFINFCEVFWHRCPADVIRMNKYGNEKESIYWQMANC